MKRIIFVTVVLMAALPAIALAGDPLSPLFEARLVATLAEWDAAAPVQAQDSGDPAWWPVSLNPASLCAASACAQSLCFGSLCAESTCLGSGCLGSTCLGSGCLASLCGVSGCVGTTLCLKKRGYTGGPPNVIDPFNNGATFVNGVCHEP
jgi:hypothetical protein